MNPSEDEYVYTPTKSNINNIISGITVGLLAIPQSVSYATIAGIPPIYGLYSDIQLLYPLFGSSSLIIVGPVAVMSLLTQQTLDLSSSELSADEKAEVARFFCLLVCFLHIIFLKTYVYSKLDKLLSKTVIKGFVFSAGVTIASTQLSNLFGLRMRKTSNLFEQIIQILSELMKGKFSKIITVTSILALFLLFFIKSEKTPKSVRNLGPLILLSINFFFDFIFYLTNINEKYLPRIGNIPAGLPSLHFIPNLDILQNFNFIDLFHILINLSIMTLLGFAEGITIAKSVDKNVDQGSEAKALAACNFQTYIFGGYPITGSFSRTAVNKDSGANSQLSSIISSILVCFVLLFGSTFVSLMSKNFVSAIVFTAILKVIKLDKFETNLLELVLVV
eukprot:snap_masked-scaffold_103-processed-gene-0.6-mRNA-1 protein AED:1.00 eAED:1.00 QI:0/0/0/0/1/1/3/0/390